jgi:hypothetical protein
MLKLRVEPRFSRVEHGSRSWVAGNDEQMRAFLRLPRAYGKLGAAK